MFTFTSLAINFIKKSGKMTAKNQNNAIKAMSKQRKTASLLNINS